MKKILKCLSVSMLSVMMVLCSMIPASAKEQLIITEKNIQELDQFVKVENNQYVLDIPDYVIIDNNLKNNLIIKNKEINKIILEENYLINLETKIASPSIQTRAYGVNKISFSWNSIIVRMDAGLVRLLAGLGTGVGVGVALPKIAAVFPALAAVLGKKVWAGPLLEGIVGIVTGDLYKGVIKDGLEIHYNFFLLKVTVIRLQ